VNKLRDPIAINVLANNVRKHRTIKKMSMEVLANKANIEYSQLSRIELEKINTTVSVIFAIANALEVEPYQLLQKEPVVKS
jgi:transcriptional regulator with XRE-family HTH domain